MQMCALMLLLTANIKHRVSLQNPFTKNAKLCNVDRAPERLSVTNTPHVPN